jgi:hypothetical protein
MALIGRGLEHPKAQAPSRLSERLLKSNAQKFVKQRTRSSAAALSRKFRANLVSLHRVAAISG